LLLNAGFDSNQNPVAGHNSGQCGSFAHLLIGALAVNGIHSAWAVVAPVNQTQEFLVKDWSPPSSNQSGPWQLCESPGAFQVGDVMVPAPTNNLYCDLTSLGTLPGQNTAPPSEKIFARHFIVKPLNVSGAPTYVDPSYGVTYASAADFQGKAVFGYFNPGVPVGYKANPLDSQNPIPIYSVSPPSSSTVNIGIAP